MFRSSKPIRHNPLPFIWQQMNIQFRMRALSLFSFGLLVFQPAVFSAIGYLLARMAGKTAPDLVYVIIGGGVMGLWSSLIFTSFYDISYDRREGTLELIVASPTRLITVMAVKTMTNVLVGASSTLLSFIVVLLVFHYHIPPANLPYVLISLFILMFGFWCIGLFLAHFQAWSRVTGMFVNYLELPVAVLAAFMFPVEYLPRWILWLSNSIPVRWGVSGLDSAFQARISLTAIWPNWMLGLGISCVYLITTLLMSKRIHDMIRINGELGSI